MQDIFEQLKRDAYQKSGKEKTIIDIFFQLNFDEIGAHIDIVNSKGKSAEADYRAHSGSVREVLRSFENIKRQLDFAIDWEKDNDKVYLSEHDYLMWQLQHCKNVVDSQQNELFFAVGEGKIIIKIQAEDEERKTMYAQVALVHQDNELTNLLPVTENYILHENTLYPINSIGNNYNRLSAFQTRFAHKDLEKYLSLLYSYSQNIELNYEDYAIAIDDKNLAKPQPTLIFEKIDEANSLFVRVTQTLPNFDADFLEKYDLDCIASVNDMENLITIKNIEYSPIEKAVDEVKTLIQSKSKLKKGEVGVFSDGNLIIVSETLARDFIKIHLPQLLTTYQVFGAEKLRNYKIIASVAKLNFALKSGIDFLEGDASLEIEGQKFNVFDVITQYKKNRYVMLNDGTQAILNEKYLQRLERIFKRAKGKDGVKISFFDLPLIEDLISDKITSKIFEKSQKVFEGFNGLKSKRFSTPKNVKAELRPYQQQGVKWLNYLHENKLGGCLADDMGLGKTLQTITLLSTIYPEMQKPTLIIMPKSLLFNWENEIGKFNPTLTYYMYYGATRELEKAVTYNLVLTTYAMMRNSIEQFKEKEFYYVILDESQNIKNLSSQASKAVMLLQAEHRLALSGTPVENNLTELYSLFRFLNPAMFGTIDEFNKHYTYPIQAGTDKDVSLELRKKIYPFILRRLKKHVLKELPPKIEQILYVEMADDQRRLYEERRRYFQELINQKIGTEGIEKSQFVILQAMTELRQIASTPESKSDGLIVSAKRELLVENLLEATANGHKVLVFVSFINALDTICEELTQAGIEYVSMSGATTDRQTLVNRFQQDKNCKVFVMTLKTGGVGLNLTAADMVFIYDPWWNIAAENQAIDRTHRMGQEKTVMSYKLITKGTIEEKILKLQEYKKELFDNIIGSDSASIKSMSQSDIDFMLG